MTKCLLSNNANNDFYSYEAAQRQKQSNANLCHLFRHWVKNHDDQKPTCYNMNNAHYTAYIYIKLQFQENTHSSRTKSHQTESNFCHDSTVTFRSHEIEINIMFNHNKLDETQHDQKDEYGE